MQRDPAGDQLGIPQGLLRMQPAGPTLDVCPLAPAAAPSSPVAPFESPRPFPEMSQKEEASPLASPRPPTAAAWGLFWVLRKEEGCLR